MSAARWLGVDLDLVRRRSGYALAAGGVAASAAFLALAYVARAGEIVLAARFGLEVAALVVAAIAALVALAGALTAVLVLRRTRHEVSRAVAASAVVAAAPTAATLALRHTRLAAAVAAVGVGYWLARRIR